MQTPTRRLADLLLADRGTTLPEFVSTRRVQGTSWRQVSLDLRDQTGLDVTHESLRRWFPEYIDITPTEAASA